MARGARRAETRIGHEARAAATGRLDAALREGRLDLAEYERRLVVIQASRVRDDLTPAIADLPVHSGQTGPGLRISTVDREQALVRLADALTDGRIEADAYVDAEELLHRAVAYEDLDAVVGDLDARASVAERDQAVARIEAAAAGGQLEPTERDARVAAVRSATTDAQLAALVADLSSGTRSPGAPLRASNADREAVAARLQDAVEAGFLDVAEFDERVRAVYAARLRDELARLVEDLPEPEQAIPTPPPAPPPVVSRPRSGCVLPDRAGGALAVVIAHTTAGTAIFGASAIFLATNGLVVTPVFLGVAWLMLTVKLVKRARRLARAPRATGPAPRVRRLSELLGHKRSIRALTCLVLPDGTPLAISGAKDNTAMVWDLARLEPRHKLTGHTNNVVAVAAMVLPDGTPIAVTASDDETVMVWDLRDGSPRGTLQDRKRDHIKSVACLTLPDGTPVALVLGYEAIQMWDLRDLTLIRRFRSDLTTEGLVPMVIPHSGPVAVLVESGDGPALELLSLKSGKRWSRLRGHTGSITAIDTTVLPNGTPVAVSTSLDKTIRVWNLRQGTNLRTSPACSPRNWPWSARHCRTAPRSRSPPTTMTTRRCGTCWTVPKCARLTCPGPPSPAWHYRAEPLSWAGVAAPRSPCTR